MRLVTVSVTSVMLCAAAFADARLPVVNIGAGAVSARAAFGEDVVAQKSVAPSKKITARASKSVAPKMAQATTSNVTAGAKNTSVDTGTPIAQIQTPMGDVLMPRRPSGDLWAKTDAPLRMPLPQEISVLRSDAELPEEYLDGAPIAAARSATPVVQSPVAVATPTRGDSALDREIEKMVNAARVTDNAARPAAVRPVSTKNSGAVASRTVMPRRAVKNGPVVTENTEPKVAAVTTPAAPVAVETAPIVESVPVTPVASSTVADNAPAVRRMVVPMGQSRDVIVRSATPTAPVAVTLASAETDMSSMSPTELRKAFRKTYLSENKHLSTFQVDDRFDVASDMTSSAEGFTAARDLSESGGVRPLEIKIKFRGDDASLSRENYNLLTEYASIVLANPKRSVQVSIPESATQDTTARKLAARRLAIVEQVLRDTGVSEHRIMPVLAARDDQGFVLRIISNDQFETLTQKKRDMFGDTVSKKTYTSLSW